MCKLFFCFCVTDRWWCERQSVVGVGPHSHSVWEETDKKVGEPAAYWPTVSTGYPLTCDEAWLSVLNQFSLFLRSYHIVLENKSEHQQFVRSVGRYGYVSLSSTGCTIYTQLDRKYCFKGLTFGKCATLTHMYCSYAFTLLSQCNRKQNCTVNAML